MKVFHQLFVVVIFASTQVVGSEEIDQSLIDYYVDYINKHTEDALRYEPPKDARMYEANNKQLLGKSINSKIETMKSNKIISLSQLISLN